MTEPMTFAGLDVHARSTHAAAIDVVSGELRRARFGARQCGGIGVAAAAAAAGTGLLRGRPDRLRALPRGRGGRRRSSASSRRARHRARPATGSRPTARTPSCSRGCYSPAQLKPIAVPSISMEAARHLCRAREQVRADLMRCRHRVSKLLLLHGRVYPEPTTWTSAHRRWLAGQRFDQRRAELAYLDTLAAVDGLVARKAALDERLSRLALRANGPTVARLRCFRGIDTLSALVLALEIGDCSRFAPAQLSSWLGLVPALDQSGESRRQGSITKTGSSYARRLLVEAAWQYRASRGSASRYETANRDNPHRCCRSPGARNTASTDCSSGCARAASPPTSPPSQSPANSPASSGPPPSATNPTPQPPLLGRAPDRRRCRHARCGYGQPPKATPASRQRTPATKRRHGAPRSPHIRLTDGRRLSAASPRRVLPRSLRKTSGEVRLLDELSAISRPCSPAETHRARCGLRIQGSPGRLEKGDAMAEHNGLDGRLMTVG